VAFDPPLEADLDVEMARDDGTVSLEIVEVDWNEDAGAVDAKADESKATFQVYEDSAGEHRWRLRHENGNIIADGGQGYSSKQKAKQGLQSVKTNSAGAAVEEA
jgi:uncharacterized protein YegP (UPF0339 family)